MAKQEHLDILKQGVEVWNQWRKEHPKILPDLSDNYLAGFDFRGINLNHANLRRTSFSVQSSFDDVGDLSGADLSGANLSKADLYQAELYSVNMRGANLRSAFLNEADLAKSDLTGADLEHASLSLADLRGTKLIGVNLSSAVLFGALVSGNLSNANLSRTSLVLTVFSRADLSSVNFSEASLEGTIFANVDLGQVQGLDTVHHRFPSEISVSTLYRSAGKIPETFLRGVGIPDVMIEYIHSLVNQPINYYTCFISYSGKDQSFAERLYTDLQSKGVRCWFAPEDMKIGDKIRYRIDESIRLYDKLLLVLSEHSVASQWVEHEVETAIGKELEGKPNVLFPVRLDEAIMNSKTGWASHIRLTRHIGDFTRWKYHDEYQKGLNRLLRDLKASS